MAPVNQLGVLAFAAGALAVPHAQWQPFKRHAHAHASAPAGYESSYVPAYGVSSSSIAEPASESWSAPAYPSASGSASWSAYPSGSSAEPVSGSASWSAPAYPSGSSAGAESGSAPPYPSASGSKSGWAFPTGGYGYPSSSWGTGYSAYPTGYSSYASAYPSISVCTETSTLIWKTTTSLSTYYVTHTLYESSAAAYSSVAPASASSYNPGYSAPGYSAPGYSAPASAPAGGEAGASCVPDVTVTETVKTTVYVTPGASSAAAVSSASATPACWTACFQQAGITAESQLCGNTAVDKCIQDTCSSAEDKAYWAWYESFCPATSSAAVSVSAVPSSAAASSYPAAPSSASAAAPSYSAPASGGQTGKRGLAYNDANLANALAGTAAGGWAYNWLSDGTGLDSSIPYIPMLWGPSSDFTGTWQANAQKGIANGAQYLFSFNEADMSTQSNLSPEAAAAAWKQYMEPFAGQIKLVAPSVTNSQDSNMGLNWLQSFFDACSGCTIDAVAQHWYFPTNDVQNFKDQITSAAGMAGGKGVFVNEFGAVGTDDEKSAFLSEVMPWLDSNPDVLGYSYFMVSDGLLMSGDGPSSLGDTYCS